MTSFFLGSPGYSHIAFTTDSSRSMGLVRLYDPSNKTAYIDMKRRCFSANKPSKLRACVGAALSKIKFIVSKTWSPTKNDASFLATEALRCNHLPFTLKGMLSHIVA